MLKFITRNYVLLLAVFAVAILGSFELLAQGTGTATATTDALGPFGAFLRRGADLFYYTRNALFVVTAFVFIKYAWGAITEGKFEWKELFWLIVALVLLGVAGYVVEWFAGSTVYSQLNQKQSGQHTTGFSAGGWGPTTGTR